jgi:hypothetical protein
MAATGLLRRTPYRAEHRTHNEYQLTDAGAELLPVLHALALWGEKHTTAPAAAAHLEIVHRPCGRATTTSDLCSHCGATLLPDEVSWRRPWREPELTALAGSGD